MTAVREWQGKSLSLHRHLFVVHGWVSRQLVGQVGLRSSWWAVASQYFDPCGELVYEAWTPAVVSSEPEPFTCTTTSQLLSQFRS